MTENPAAEQDPVAAMDSLLDRLVAVLSGNAAAGRPTSGTAEDDAIVVTVGPDGHVQDIDLDARLLRRPDAIGPGIAAAANEAIRARPARDGTGAMTEDLRAIQEESLTLTRQLNASLLDSLERLKRS